LRTTPNARPIAFLLILSAAAVLIHGFHPYVEDGEIYVPGMKHALNPALYPQNPDFFMSHARMTMFPHWIAGSVRITHFSWDWALFLWHFGSIFLFLLGCWRIGRLTFRDPIAAWGGTALVASLLTIPVAGTALYIMDQYLTPRALSTPATLFILVNAIERRWIRTGLWLLFTATIHPLMVVFALCYLVLLLWFERRGVPATIPRQAAMAVAVLVPLGLFPPVTDAYREILQSRSYFFLLRWEWYEWLGIFAPLLLLEWFGRIARQQQLALLERLCRVTTLFGLTFFVAALILTIPERFANLAELQPMRCLQLVYILLFIFAGGLLAQFVLQREAWRWLLLFAPICAGMCYAQRQLFPATAHVEWPGVPPRNPWVQAFVWVRNQTPPDAFFALDPNHLRVPGEDQQGFRAIAERSRLADRVKDSGVVSMFPRLAETWRNQVRALDGWKDFKAEDFARLKRTYGVDWVILENPGVPGLACPYRNSVVLVCRLE
jgi:hypothetical protein